MIDHISFSVNNYEESRKFYDETLSCLGMKCLVVFETEEHKVAGYGIDGRPDFWMGESSRPNMNEFVGKARGFHVAFRAPSVEAVRLWYKKSLEIGGKDNGAPNPRPEYHLGYYGAFIIDPNGYRIEAALHDYKP